MKDAITRLFGEGFRIFFLAAGVFGLLTVLYWETWLGIHAFGGMVTRHPFAPPPHLWHAHEMIFGYAGAALGGFFLTAVPNWTGAKAARHAFIALAVCLWVAGRVAIWWSGSLPPLLVAAIDLAFVPVLATKILSQLMRRPKPQNMMFLGLLTILWVSNLIVHLDWTGIGGPGAEIGIRAGLLTICATIAVLGGRVTPAFTRNAMTRSGLEWGLPVSRKAFEITGIATAIALPLLVLFDIDKNVFGAVAILAGAGQMLRLAGWRSTWTLNQPILWSLHLAFVMLGSGYLLLGLAELGVGSEVAALHLLGIGAVGGMTISVMTRAILGHTGRQLVAPAPVSIAFALMAVAACIRWIGSSATIDAYFVSMLVSGAAWIVALTLFLTALAPAILGPRKDA
jgi:uncharacterized protein involved in response to NO